MAQPTTLNRNQAKNDIWQNLGKSFKDLARKLWPYLNYEDRVQSTLVLDYNLTCTRSADTFEIIYGFPRRFTTVNPFIGTNYGSSAINPATGNTYANDYNTRLLQIGRGNRYSWQDSDDAKYFDWQYTFVNPASTLDQVWPGGLILSDSKPAAWNSATTYSATSRVSYNGFVWVCTTANTNQTPTTPSSFWQNTGIPVNTGYTLTGCTVPNSYNDTFPFNYYANLYAIGNITAGQYNYTGGVGAGGVYEISGLWNKSDFYQPSGIPGKMPVVNLNTFMSAANSNRYPTPFNVQHQMDMLDFINTGLGNPNLPKVDHVQLGSNHFLTGYSASGSTCNLAYGNTTTSGYNYGAAMVAYVAAIRGNSAPETANAKIIIETGIKIVGGGALLRYQYWGFDPGNPLNPNVGFLHGFYNPINNPSNIDFDIISIKTSPNRGPDNWNNSVAGVSNISIGYFHTMSGTRGAISSTMPDLKTILRQYGKESKVKFWVDVDTMFWSPTFGQPSYNTPAPPGYSLGWVNYSWAATISHLGAFFFAATSPDVSGLRWRLFDTTTTANGFLYTSTDTFGPGTTKVTDYTALGHMFNTLLADRFNPAMGAIRYTRITSTALVASTNLDFYEGVFGIYIESDGSNYSKNTIVLINWNNADSAFVNLNLTQLIDPSWTNVQFQKVYTIGSQYDPVNYFVTPGTFVEIQQDTPYTPTAAQINSTPLYPTEYLIITAD